MRIDSHGLEAFLTVVRYGTLSRAAEHLNVSQSALSQRIRSIEDTLRVSVIDRGRGRPNITLTPAGQKLLIYAERWEILRRDLHQAHLGGAATVNIGMSASVSDFLLKPLFARLAETDRVMINLHMGNSPELYGHINRHEVDMAFVLHAQRLDDATITPVLSEKLVVASKTPLPQDAAGLVPVARLDPHLQINLRYGGAFNEWSASVFGPVEVPQVQLSNIHLIDAFLARPGSWAMVPVSVGHTLAAREAAFIGMPDRPPPDRQLYRVRRRQLSKQTSKGCDLIEALLAEIPLPPMITRLD